VTNNWIEVQIENWQQNKWHPGLYNITLQVVDGGGAAVTQTNWIRIWVNPGDLYADLFIPELSMWYFFGENVLGPPDGQYTRLYFDYGNGHVTLDMGPGEEILDGRGIDFTVYARGGEYVVFGSNNLSTSILVGNQVTAPLVLLGEGYYNTSFDLASINLTQVRYLQIVYLGGEEVELDAVAAINFNHPPRPISQFERWRFLIGGTVLVLSVIIIFWIRKRKW